MKPLVKSTGQGKEDYKDTQLLKDIQNNSSKVEERPGSAIDEVANDEKADNFRIPEQQLAFSVTNTESSLYTKERAKDEVNPATKDQAQPRGGQQVGSLFVSSPVPLSVLWDYKN